VPIFRCKAVWRQWPCFEFCVRQTTCGKLYSSRADILETSRKILGRFCDGRCIYRFWGNETGIETRGISSEYLYILTPNTSQDILTCTHRRIQHARPPRHNQRVSFYTIWTQWQDQRSRTTCYENTFLDDRPFLSLVRDPTGVALPKKRRTTWLVTWWIERAMWVFLSLYLVT